MIELGQFLGRLTDGQLVGQLTGQAGHRGRFFVRLRQVLPRVLFAQMQFLRLAPLVSSVMWNVAVLSHCWHFMEGNLSTWHAGFGHVGQRNTSAQSFSAQ